MRCSATAVFPVPGAPWTMRMPDSGERITRSCSAWMVPTMSRILPVRAASSATISAPSPATTGPSRSGS